MEDSPLPPTGSPSTATQERLTARERLLRAAELMPDGASVTIPREALIDALTGPEPALPTPEPRQDGDRLLTAAEAAERLGVDKRWLYEHADDLPFRRKLSDRCTRYSEKELERYMSGACDHCGNRVV